MNERRHRAPWPLALALACALAGAGWAVARTPPGPGEAALLLTARDPATAPACPPAPGAAGALDVLACALPGVAARVPGLAALGHRLGGLSGARALFALAAPLLVLAAWRVGSGRRWGARGPLAAITFVALGVPLQLVATVHPRAVAVLLAGFAAALLERPAPGDAAMPGAGPLRAALAGAALALAATATPVVAVLVLPLAIALAPGRAARASAAAFASAGLAVLTLSATAGRAAWGGLGEALRSCPPGGWSAAAPRLALLLEGLAMPLLLAVFAIFHRDGGGRAVAAIAVAAPAALVPLLSARLDDVRTAQLAAFTILAPAAAVGVARMSETFSAGNPSRLARPLFAAATLVVAAVHGLDAVRTLRRDAEPERRPPPGFAAPASPVAPAAPGAPVATAPASSGAPREGR